MHDVNYIYSLKHEVQLSLKIQLSIKVNVKSTPEYATKAQRVSTCTPLLLL